MRGVVGNGVVLFGRPVVEGVLVLAGVVAVDSVEVVVVEKKEGFRMKNEPNDGLR